MPKNVENDKIILTDFLGYRMRIMTWGVSEYIKKIEEPETVLILPFSGGI